MKLPERSEGNFFMFLKTNEGYLSQIARKNMQLMVLKLHFALTYLYSFLPLDLSINFPKLVINNIDSHGN